MLLYLITGKFNECMASKKTSFANCVHKMAKVDGCGTWGQGCAPTLNMLRKSEKPINEIGIENFGKAFPPTGHPRPDTSVCTAKKIWN